MTESNVFQLCQPGTFADPLTEVLRNGARVLLTRLHQLRGVGDAKVLKSLGHSPKGRHYRG